MATRGMVRPGALRGARSGDGGRAAGLRTPPRPAPLACLSRRVEPPARRPLARAPACEAGVGRGLDRGCVRNGVADMLVAFAPLLCERRARVTPTRTRVGLAETLRWVSDDLFPEAERIVLVCDNPDTHPVGVALRGLPAGGGRAAGLPPRGPSHAQAREPAGHGGDRGRLPRAVRPSGMRREFRRDGRLTAAWEVDRNARARTAG